jgi:hypothetical protein
MFQQAPTEIVPLGNYNIDQSLFDVIDTPEGAVEKGLDKSPGFQMWEKGNPVRAQKAREVVAAQKAERAPAERVAQREAVKQNNLYEAVAAGFLPPLEALADYGVTPAEYEALKVNGVVTAEAQGGGFILSPMGSTRLVEVLDMRREDPESYGTLIAGYQPAP